MCPATSWMRSLISLRFTNRWNLGRKPRSRVGPAGPTPKTSSRNHGSGFRINDKHVGSDPQGGMPMSVDRMSPLDASFLHIEDDGVSHMHIASVGIFEGPEPRFDEIVSMIKGKLPLVPRYRQVVRSVPLDLGRPVWVDDPHFNIAYHLRHTALPAPGGEAELRRLVGRVMSQPLDRTKPLWEIWIVQGLEDDRWAMLSKTHHAVVDGVSGTDLLAVVMDITPEPSQPIPDSWRPEAAPSRGQLA